MLFGCLTAILSRIVLRLKKATFVAASPSDLLWLDQSDLVAAIDEHPEIKACLEKTATIAETVRTLRTAEMVYHRSGRIDSRNFPHPHLVCTPVETPVCIMHLSISVDSAVV